MFHECFLFLLIDFCDQFDDAYHKMIHHQKQYINGKQK